MYNYMPMFIVGFICICRSDLFRSRPRGWGSWGDEAETGPGPKSKRAAGFPFFLFVYQWFCLIIAEEVLPYATLQLIPKGRAVGSMGWGR